MHKWAIGHVTDCRRCYGRGCYLAKDWPTVECCDCPAGRVRSLYDDGEPWDEASVEVTGFTRLQNAAIATTHGLMKLAGRRVGVLCRSED
jgi:hypothetical protein